MWSLDNHDVLFVRRKPRPASSSTPNHAAGLAKVRIDTAETQNVLDSIVHDPVPSVANDFFATVAMDGERIFYTTRIPQAPSQITLFQPRSHTRVYRFHPLDSSLPIGALSLCPLAGEPRLALRLATRLGWSPPAFCHPPDEKITPLVPDDSARWNWIVAIALAARDVITDASSGDGNTPARPTLLPLPGEFTKGDDAGLSLNRLALVGRGLCDRPADSAELDPPTRDFLLEMRLFFNYLLEDYGAVKAALPALEPLARSTGLRERLIGLRAQVDLGLGDVPKARDAMACLRASSTAAPRLIEETSRGYVLAPAPSVQSGWAWALSERILRGPSTVARRPKPAAAEDDAVGFPQLRPAVPDN